ncbi:PXL2A-like protein [Mya arenaria]|uniref:Peroxiredoxin-like 2A n=1 Tax=Mya arenaria TaxID=6604 RepID=A0ABY7DJ82_MYAAR|nr:PXL2A-like protein [Mya arenaria]WAQ97016.1 PXL2A-like protein [Mya arenaria]
MGLPKLFMGLAAVGAGASIICNLAATMVTKPQAASLQYLAESKLQSLDEQKRNFSASELWSNRGAVIMAEAEGLSSLLPEMEARGVRLHAVVHEAFGADDFKPFIKGDVYLDLERRFYGPHERWMNIPGIFNYESLWQVFSIWQKGVPGNLKGEGRLLGAVFVVGPGDQGVLFQHNEMKIGDIANLDMVREAIQRSNLPKS